MYADRAADAHRLDKSGKNMVWVSEWAVVGYEIKTQSVNPCTVALVLPRGRYLLFLSFLPTTLHNNEKPYTPWH